MSYQDLMNIKVNILPNVMKELHLHLDLQDPMLLPSYHKIRHYYGLTDDTFYKLKSNCMKDGQWRKWLPHRKSGSNISLKNTKKVQQSELTPDLLQLKVLNKDSKHCNKKDTKLSQNRKTWLIKFGRTSQDLLLVKFSFTRNGQVKELKRK